MTPAELTQSREELHLSQRDLAKVLGVHYGIVNRWERGRAKIPPYMKHTMAGVEDWLRIASAVKRERGWPSPEPEPTAGAKRCGS